MLRKEQSGNDVPSPPLEGNTSSNVIGQNTSLVLYQQPSVQPVLLGPQPPVRCDVGLPPYRFVPFYDAFALNLMISRYCFFFKIQNI